MILYIWKRESNKNLQLNYSDSVKHVHWCKKKTRKEKKNKKEDEVIVFPCHVIPYIAILSLFFNTLLNVCTENEVQIPLS